jgi:dTDP-4-amino-4,6-dideoxygalactose transaminase
MALMGIGNNLVGGLEELLIAQSLRRQALYRMTGATSQCWRAEREIQQMYPCMQCLLLPSATIGLSLLLELLKLEPGQEVLITPFGWLSNWSCILRAGLVPRFMPLDDDLQLHVEQVAKRINERTGAVIVTHLMGRGQQATEAVAELCTNRRIHLLEDIAQSFGISVRGKRAGTFGGAAWCSLNRHKLLSTGDGGFVLVRDARIFGKLSALHDQGCVIREGKRRPAEIVEPGLSLRSTELIAAVLRAQLARFHLIRTRILAMHHALAKGCELNLGLQLIKPHDGDLPFTVLFKRSAQKGYPSLADSGWHIAANVPWLATACAEAAQSDPEVGATFEKLAATSALGAGFVDSYYAVPAGLKITDSIGEVPQVINALEKSR